jgi:hypothetical protein
MTEGLEVLTNPQMIVEVLLPSTEAFDRDENLAITNQSRVLPSICLSRSTARLLRNSLNKTKTSGFSARRSTSRENCFRRFLTQSFCFRRFI